MGICNWPKGRHILEKGTLWSVLCIRVLSTAFGLAKLALSFVFPEYLFSNIETSCNLVPRLSCAHCNEGKFFGMLAID